jgi:homoserine acetyltransferase
MEAGKEATYAELDSPNGHDAFLKDWDMMTEAIGPFIQEHLPG